MTTHDHRISASRGIPYLHVQFLDYLSHSQKAMAHMQCIIPSTTTVIQNERIAVTNSVREATNQSYPYKKIR